jgi:hypothetical protein
MKLIIFLLFIGSVHANEYDSLLDMFNRGYDNYSIHKCELDLPCFGIGKRVFAGPQTNSRGETNVEQLEPVIIAKFRCSEGYKTKDCLLKVMKVVYNTDKLHALVNRSQRIKPRVEESLEVDDVEIYPYNEFSSINLTDPYRKIVD